MFSSLGVTGSVLQHEVAGMDPRLPHCLHLGLVLIQSAHPSPWEVDLPPSVDSLVTTKLHGFSVQLVELLLQAVGWDWRSGLGNDSADSPPAVSLSQLHGRCSAVSGVHPAQQDPSWSTKPVGNSLSCEYPYLYRPYLYQLTLTSTSGPGASC